MGKGFRREILASILVIVISIIGFGIYFWRAGGAIREVSANVATTNQAILDQAELSQVLVDLKNAESEADRDQGRMDAVIPDEEQLLDFRSWLRNQGSVFGVSVGVDFKDRGKFREGSNILFQNAAVSMDGSADGFVSFLKELEMGADRFLVGFSSFDLNRGGSGYRLSGAAKIFFRGAPPAR